MNRNDGRLIMPQQSNWETLILLMPRHQASCISCIVVVIIVIVIVIIVSIIIIMMMMIIIITIKRNYCYYDYVSVNQLWVSLRSVSSDVPPDRSGVVLPDRLRLGLLGIFSLSLDNSSGYLQPDWIWLVQISAIAFFMDCILHFMDVFWKKRRKLLGFFLPNLEAHQFEDTASSPWWCLLFALCCCISIGWRPRLGRINLFFFSSHPWTLPESNSKST